MKVDFIHVFGEIMSNDLYGFQKAMSFSIIIIYDFVAKMICLPTEEQNGNANSFAILGSAKAVVEASIARARAEGEINLRKSLSRFKMQYTEPEAEFSLKLLRTRCLCYIGEMVAARTGYGVIR